MAVGSAEAELTYHTLSQCQQSKLLLLSELLALAFHHDAQQVLIYLIARLVILLTLHLY